MASQLGVTPEGLSGDSVHLADIMAEMATAIATFSETIVGTIPAGADSASLLAANAFSLHGLNFVTMGVESQTILAQASTAIGYSAVKYGAQEAANTTLLA